MLQRWIVPVALIVIAVAAGCGGGGGGGSTAPPVTPGTNNASTAALRGTLVLQIPNRPTSGKNRKPQFVSTAAASAVLTLNGTATAYDVSATSSLCVTANGARTCTIAVSVPAGTTTVTVSIAITDGIAGGGTTLGIGSNSTTIAPGATSFSLNVDVSPVVAAVAASLTFPNGLAQIANGNVENGTAIVTYYDPDSVPIPPTSNSTFVTPLTLTASDPNVTISPASITKATQVVRVIYNGTPLTTPTVTFTLKAGATTLGTFPVTVAGIFTEYPIPTGSSFPEGIAVGADNGLWFAESASLISQIARIDPATHAVLEYPIPRGTVAPTVVAPAPLPNHEMWFNEPNPGTAQVGKITTNGSATFTEFPFVLNVAQGLVAAGGLMWVAGTGPDEVVALDPVSDTQSGAVVALAGCSPAGIGLDTLGKLWVTCPGNNSLVEIDPALRTVITTMLTLGTPSAITPGSDNAMWFTETTQGKIGRVTIGATPIVTEFTLPNGGAQPAGIALGPDSAMWFTEFGIDKIGRIDFATHTIVEFPVTATAAPYGIVTGPDGFLWFTENFTTNIGRMQP